MTAYKTFTTGTNALCEAKLIPVAIGGKINKRTQSILILKVKVPYRRWRCATRRAFREVKV